MNTIVEHINSAGFSFVEFALPMLIQSGVLIVVLLLADLFLRKKVKAVFRYWIWMLVLVKLVLPTSLSSPLSLGYLFGDKLTYQDLTETTLALESTEPAPAETLPGMSPVYIQPNPYIPPEVPVISGVEPAVTEPVGPPAVPVTPLSWQGIVFLVWLAVVIAMGLLLLQRALFVRGLVAQAKKAGPLMNDALVYCCASMGIKCKVGLKVSPNATTPSVCGLIRPVILVPWNLASTLGASRLRTVLIHELVHIRRADLWVNLAQTVLQIIYFYNPLLWIANCVIRRIREQAVDEAVLVAMGGEARQYPQTLVDVAKMAFKRPALSLRLIGVVESKSALAGRIKHILGRPMPRSARLGIVGVLAVIIAGAVLLPMAAGKDDEGASEDMAKASEFMASLPNGVTVELVGICEHPSEGKQWWLPDGTLWEDRPYEEFSSHNMSGEKGYELVWRLSSNEDVVYEVESADQKGSAGRDVLHNERGLRATLKNGEFYGVIFFFSPGLSQAAIRIGVGLDKNWKTIASLEGDLSKAASGINNVHLYPAIEADGRTYIDAAYSFPEGKRQAYRLVAVDTSNRQHLMQRGSETKGRGNIHCRKQIDLPLKQIKTIHFQTLSLQWITFEDVSLRPGMETDAQVSAQEIVDKIIESERKIEDIQLHMTCTIPARKLVFYEFDWGYDGGKEFYTGYQNSTEPGSDKISRTTQITKAFDGKKEWRLRISSTDKQPRGGISEPHFSTFRGRMTFNTLLGFDAKEGSRLSFGEAIAQAESVSVKDKVEFIDGHPCYVIEAVNIETDPSVNWAYDVRAWIDYQRDYRLLKFEKCRSISGRNRFKVVSRRVDNIKLRQVDGIWLPIEGRRTTFSTNDYGPPRGMSLARFVSLSTEEQERVGVFKLKPMSPPRRLEVDADSIRLNKGIPPQRFTIAFPEGCEVNDGFTGNRYVVGEPSEREAALSDADWIEQMAGLSVSELIDILRNSSVGKDKKKWFAAVHRLVEIGSAAVPELVAELRQTEKPQTQSKLALTLRAIGDPSAVPGLIDGLGRSGFSSDYGMGQARTELDMFFRQHQLDPSKKSLGLARPVREITITLEKLTGHTEGHDHFHAYDLKYDRLGSYTVTPEITDRQRAHRRQVAHKWRIWWQANKDDIKPAETPPKPPVESRPARSKKLEEMILAAPEGSILTLAVVPNVDGSARRPSLTKEQYQRYLDDLAQNGPSAGSVRGDSFQWSPVKGDPTRFKDLPLSTYEEQTYLLLCARSQYVMMPELEGRLAWGLEKVQAGRDENGKPMISIEFDEKGSGLFYELTKANIGNHLAMGVDGWVLSAPAIETTLTKRAVITGDFTEQQMHTFVEDLRKGMTPVDQQTAKEMQLIAEAADRLNQQDVAKMGPRRVVESFLIAGLAGLSEKLVWFVRPGSAVSEIMDTMDLSEELLDGHKIKVVNVYAGSRDAFAVTSDVTDQYGEQIGQFMFYLSNEGGIWLIYDIDVGEADRVRENLTDFLSAHPDVTVEGEKTSRTEFTAILPNGMAVELVGLCKEPVDGAKWWKPDGGNMTEPFFRASKRIPPLKGMTTRYTFLAKAQGSENISIKMKIYEGFGWSTRVAEDGTALCYVKHPNDAKPHHEDAFSHGPIEVGVAQGQWIKGRGESSPNIQTPTSYSIGSRDEIVIQPPRPEKNSPETATIFWFTSSSHDYEYRLICTLKDGSVEECTKPFFQSTNKIEAGNLKNSTLDTKSFSIDRPLEQIVNYELLYRKFDYARFNNVAFKPNAKTDVQVDDMKERIVRGPEQVRAIDKILREWFAACVAGDVELMKNAYSPGYQLVERDMQDMNELFGMNPGWQFSLLSAMWDKEKAMAVSGVMEHGDLKVGGPMVLVWTFNYSEGKWGIIDIDLEEIEGLQLENSRFLQKHPNAQVWFDNPEFSLQTLSLVGAPRTTKLADLPDLFEKRPPGSKSYHRREDVDVVYSGLDGTVYYIPKKKIFYVQHDKLGSSTRTYYGPFKGDPHRLLRFKGNVELEPVLTEVIEAAKEGISLPVKKISSDKSGNGGSFEWETSIEPRVRFRHGWYTIEDGLVREHVGAGASRNPEQAELNLKLNVEVKDNMLNLKVQRAHDLVDGSRTAAVAGKTPVPAGTYLEHGSSVDSAVLTNKHLTLWQGDFIRDGKVVKSVIYAAYLTTPDDPDWFKPPVLQKKEFVTARDKSDVPVEVEQSRKVSKSGDDRIVVVSEGKSTVYSSIKEAVDAAPAGSVIRVDAGVYGERPELEVEQSIEASEATSAVLTVPEAAKTRGGISGVVVNSVTGEPIAGAYVGVGDFGDSGGSNYSRHREQGFHDKTNTDEQGRFELDGLAFTDDHPWLKSHPLVVTHPDFVRHDEEVELLKDKPTPHIKVSLRPAAIIDVTIVDAQGNPLEAQWLIRLQALDGRRFIPPGSDPHLSSFASSIWVHWPDFRKKMGASQGFTFTELDTGQYSIEALKFQLVDKPTPQNIWEPVITYHGSIPSLKIEAGQSRKVKLAPQDNRTRLTVTPPEFPDMLFGKLKRSSQMPLMCLVSRSPELLLWDDEKIFHLEDQRLGRIDKKRFFRGFFPQDKPLKINNLPPGPYSFFAMAVYGPVAGYLIGARADLAEGDDITVDIPWRQPTGASMVGPSPSFDNPVKLEDRDYTVSDLCEILTDITKSNPRIIADPSIENEKLRFGKSQMSVWDILEKLYLDRGWRLDEGENKTLIIRPGVKTDVQGEVEDLREGVREGLVSDSTLNLAKDLTPKQLLELMKASREKYKSSDEKLKAMSYQHDPNNKHSKKLYFSREIISRYTEDKSFSKVVMTMHSEKDTNGNALVTTRTYAIGPQKSKRLEEVSDNRTPRAIIALGNSLEGEQAFFTTKMALWDLFSWPWDKINFDQTTLGYNEKNNIYFMQAKMSSSPRGPMVRLYIDPAKDFIPVRREFLKHDGTLLVAFTCDELRKTAEGLWIPYKYSWFDPRASFSAEYQVQEVVLNKPIPDNLLDFSFPEGTFVIDQIMNTEYKVTATEQTGKRPDVEAVTKKPVVGKWEDVGNPIPADFNDTLALTEQITLGSIGRDVEGKAFITFVWENERKLDRQYRFVLINKDDVVLEPDSHLILGESRRLEEKFTFDETYVPWRLKEFKFQSRPMPLAGARSISSRLQKDTSAAFEGKTFSPSELAPPGRYAIELDGVDDYLLIPDSPTLRLEPPFTIEMWIKPKLPEQKPDRYDEWGVIAQGGYIGTGRVKPRGFGIELIRFEKEPAEFHISYNEASDRGIAGSDYGSYRFDDWMHISHVFEGDNYKPGPGHPLVVGRFLIPTAEPFMGQIGEIRIWNSAQTSEEIRRYKNVALTGKEPGLVACWTFEQGEGQFAYDISGNNNHARLGKSIETDDADPEWIDLEAAPLQPDRTADVPVEGEVGGKSSNNQTQPLSFGPEVRCVVHAMDAEKDSFIDFDTGKYFNTPKKRWLLFDFDVNNIGHRVEWAKKTGADATVRCSEGSDLVMLLCYDMAFKKVESADWQDLSAEQVVEDLSKATHFVEDDLGLGHLRLKPPDATRIFKTLEGGVGIIQIVGFTDNPKSVEIRYKMVQKGPAGKTSVNVVD